MANAFDWKRKDGRVSVIESLRLDYLRGRTGFGLTTPQLLGYFNRFMKADENLRWSEFIGRVDGNNEPITYIGELLLRRKGFARTKHCQEWKQFHNLIISGTLTPKVCRDRWGFHVIPEH